MTPDFVERRLQIAASSTELLDRGLEGLASTIVEVGIVLDRTKRFFGVREVLGRILDCGNRRRQLILVLLVSLLVLDARRYGGLQRVLDLVSLQGEVRPLDGHCFVARCHDIDEVARVHCRGLIVVIGD